MPDQAIAAAEIIQGHVLDVLATLPAESVSCVVTSPPYWGLRKYDAPDVTFGGDPDCPHTLGSGSVFPQQRGGGPETASAKQLSNKGTVGLMGVPGGYTGKARWQHEGVSRQETPEAWVKEIHNPHPGQVADSMHPASESQMAQGRSHESATCSRCGAWRGQYGLEPTPDCGNAASSGSKRCGACYTCHTLDVLRAIRRVLRPDGVVWWNIGDGYAGGGQGTGGKQQYLKAAGSGPVITRSHGVKAKDLILMPERIALAAQADGWWLRSRIIWQKPNAMPEAAHDRPTDDHEHIFMLVKNGVKPLYWYQARGARPTTRKRPLGLRGEEGIDWDYVRDEEGNILLDKKGRQRRATLWRSVPYFWNQEAVRERQSENTHNRGRGEGGPKAALRASEGNHMGWAESTRQQWLPSGRNLRTVWSFPTAQTPEAHFACVDEDTECLTIEGWKRQHQLTPGDKAAQFDIVTGRLSWGIVEDVARYQVDTQKMVLARSRHLDLIMTANHRCVIQRRHPQTRELQSPLVVRADELKPSHSIPVTANWEDGGDSSLSLAWAELLGWYVAEGHECKNSLAVEIYQSETANPNKVQRIEELLRSIEAEWSSTRAKRQWRGRDAVSVVFRVSGYTATRLRELAPGKAVPVAALRWGADRIEALLAGLIGGDGHVRADGRRIFTQKAKRDVDLVQALCIRLGWSATMTPRAGGTYCVYIGKHRTRSFRGTGGSGTDIDRVLYTGTVWCPKLPKGTWVARRNGRVFITGNTFPIELPLRCIQASCPREICTACGLPRVRLVERRSLSEHPARANRNVRNKADYDGEDYAERDSTLGLVGDDVTIGWSACGCGKPFVPGLTLDPFAGVGTTLLAAKRLGRRSIGIELSEKYAQMASEKLQCWWRDTRLVEPEKPKEQMALLLDEARCPPCQDEAACLCDEAARLVAGWSARRLF